MIVYFDSSALVKILLVEEGAELATEVWDRASRHITSHAAYPETRAALAAAERDRRISPAQSQIAVVDLDRMADSMELMDIDEDLARRAGILAERHALKGGDAVHLSSMFDVDEPRVVAATWDRRMALAASKNGIGVVPAPPRWAAERADAEVGPPNKLLV